MDELHLSYSGLWAKKYLTDTLKCHIMCLDKGDNAREPSRTEDSEPLPATLDPWAQGCLPVVHFTHQSAHMSPQKDECDSHQVRSSWPDSNRLISSLLLTNEKGVVSLGTSSGRPSPIGCTQRQEVRADQVKVQTVSSGKKPSNADMLCLTNSSLSTERQKTTMKHTRETRHPLISQGPPQKLDQKKKQSATLFPKADASKLLPPISHSRERKDPEVKRKSMEQTVLKHKIASGNHLQDIKTPSRLDPSCLPQKWICPQYEIVDIHTKQKPNRETRQESKLRKDLDWTAASLKPLTSSRNQLEKSNLEYAHLRKHEKEPNMTSNVAGLNKTVLAKDASLIDSQSVEINPRTCKRPTEPIKLKPIQNHPAVPLFSVEQVAKASPQVNPLFQTLNVANANN